MISAGWVGKAGKLGSGLPELNPAAHMKISTTSESLIGFGKRTPIKRQLGATPAIPILLSKFAIVEPAHIVPWSPTKLPTV